MQKFEPLRKRSGWRWQKLREQILKTNPFCIICLNNGFAVPASQVDHIIPIHKGGTDQIENLQGLCKSCHDKKTIEEQGLMIRPMIGIDGWRIE
jgi:5-methylcytosine-specific restriction protein A